MCIYTIDLPFPPTVNLYWTPRQGGGKMLTKKGRAYKDKVMLAVLQQGRPIMFTGLVKVLIKCNMPDRRVRNLDNLLKGIFDGLDAVIHLAASPSTQAPWESVLTKNIIATYNVYQEAHRAGVAKIVFASTNHVQHAYTMAETAGTEDMSYVEKNGLIKLSDPPAPDSLYGVSKLFGEDLGRYYARFFGIPFVSLRIGWAAPEIVPERAIGINKSRKYHFRVMFLSRRDLVEAFDRALQVDTDYLVAYAVSDNKLCVFDLTETREKLGFNPRDNSETYFGENISIS